MAAFQPEADHFRASRELHGALSARLLILGNHQRDDSRKLAVHLPSGLDVVLTDSYSYSHQKCGGEQPYSTLLRTGQAVLSCHIENGRNDNPNKPLFIYCPHTINEVVVGGTALLKMVEYTPVGEYTAAVVQAKPPDATPVFNPWQHDLVKPFLSY